MLVESAFANKVTLNRMEGMADVTCRNVNNRELGCFELCEISSGDNILIGDAECVFV